MAPMNLMITRSKHEGDAMGKGGLSRWPYEGQKWTHEVNPNTNHLMRSPNFLASQRFCHSSWRHWWRPRKFHEGHAMARDARCEGTDGYAISAQCKIFSKVLPSHIGDLFFKNLSLYKTCTLDHSKIDLCVITDCLMSQQILPINNNRNIRYFHIIMCHDVD